MAWEYSVDHPGNGSDIHPAFIYQRTITGSPGRELDPFARAQVDDMGAPA